MKKAVTALALGSASRGNALGNDKYGAAVVDENLKDTLSSYAKYFIILL